MRRVALAALLLATNLLASSPALWELSSFTDFVKGKFDGVSLGRDGRLSIAPKLDTVFSSGQPAVWALAPGPDGSLYAATGHRGRVFRIDRTGASTLVWTADRPEVFCLASDARGVLFAASSPDGKIYRIENGKVTEYFDPGTKYIWALTLAPDGTLYAGTGDGGRIFRITGAGKGEEYYATGQGNVTGLTLDTQGRLLAGTEPNGILYRITARNKAFALYDSSLPEIRAIAPNSDGSVYAVGLGGALAKKIQAAQQANPNAQPEASPAITTSITVTADAGGDLKPAPPEPAKPQSTVAAATTAAPAIAVSTTSAAAPDLSSVEKSAIYRINADNTVDTLWSSKEENVYDVLPGADGQLYFGTDQNGRIYRLDSDRKLRLLAETKESEAIRLLGSKGEVLAATANMGRIYKLGTASDQGRYESPVFDAGSVARWGKLRWQGSGTVAVRTRAGNSLRPDQTWSDWSPPMKDTGTQVTSPNARYLQFAAELSKSGAIDSVSTAYQPQNNPPAVRSITVLSQPAAGNFAKQTAASANSSSGATAFSVTVSDTGDAAAAGSTGTATQTLSRAASQQLTLTWQADDPDGDKLVYQVDFRGEGERDWKLLRGDLHENTWTVDGDALADGRYWFRVNASDRESNPAGTEKEAELISSPVLIDNTPPVIHIKSATRREVIFEAQDAASILRRAEWSVDAGAWTPLAPIDGILDSQAEQFRFVPDHVASGEHLIVIRVTDSGNNTALARVILH